MEEKEHQRRIWFIQLASSFAKALEKSMADFTCQEKGDFLEALIRFVKTLLNDPAEATDFYTEKILKQYKSKLATAAKEKLFWYFDPHLFGLPLIIPKVFELIPNEEQVMTEEEHQWFLKGRIRFLQNEYENHYLLEKSEPEDKGQSLEGLAFNVKGRIQRSAGDNLTKLTQEQTAFLIDYLKQARIILKDEYLSNKTAGMAFHLLTGYSAESLRIKLNERELSMLSHRDNAKAVLNALTELSNLIAKDFKDLQEPK